ncbi:MAG: SpoIIE family protein phosphatase [Acidobacteria bacterium]|nr:SpoIIE family protein phosphatase [Acidobacteriota bacterium]
MEATRPETTAEARPERPAAAEKSAVYRSFWRKLDGITEANGPSGDDFGVDRLKEIIAQNAGLPAKGLADLIFQRVEGFSRRSRPRDDQTVVVVRYPRSA